MFLFKLDNPFNAGIGQSIQTFFNALFIYLNDKETGFLIFYSFVMFVPFQHPSTDENLY